MSLRPSPALRVEHLEDRSVPAVLDLTTAAASGAVNGALFEQFDGRTVGRWELDTFVELRGGGRTLQGYNTDARRLQFDESPNRFHTHAIRVTDLPSVTAGGVKYRELVLDVSQPRTSPLVSLDELKLYVSDSPTVRGYQKATGQLGGLSPVYDLDAGGDNWVKLNARLNGRNDRGDMTVYVPDAAVAGGKYLYVYSKFGVTLSAGCGEASWSRGRCGPVGDPPTQPPAQTASIGGVVFRDSQTTGEWGVWDPDEPTVADRVVWLDDNNNGVLDAGERSTTTDASGRYSFTGLAGDATYNVRSMNDDGNPTPDRLVFVAPGDALTDVHIGLSDSAPS